jgi:L-fuconolactonase
MAQARKLLPLPVGPRIRTLLWGTDWTRAVKLLTYAEGVDAFRLAQLSDSDRAKLLGGTLSRIYDWSPAKA